jgi:hypothetical protein
MKMNGYNVELSNSNLVFRGNDIYNHLKECSKCDGLAVILGVEVDKKNGIF